jgi:ribosomal protein S18 acetylase RimI-like enzyme
VSVAAAALRPDGWLSEVLGFAVYATDAAGEVPGDDGRSLTYARVDVSDTEGVARLTSQGFAVVDVNVTFAHRGDRPAVSSGFVVEPARPEHAEALVDIAGRCFRFSRFHLDPRLPGELADRIKREWIRSYVEGRRGVELLAAVDDGTPVGFLAVLESGNARIIDLVGVAPEAQGRGAGRALVSAFVERHSASGRELRVGTQAANVPSIRLYESLGFSLVAAAFVLHCHRGM